MRYIVTLALSSLCFVSQVYAQSEVIEQPQDPGQKKCASSIMTQNLQNHMFDGIELTEQQRQQMRDLMDQFRFQQSAVSADQLEKMHALIIEKSFDENAVRTLAEKLSQQQVAEQIELARVRHQMYSLLTPQQQVALNKNYEERMDKLCDLNNLH